MIQVDTVIHPTAQVSESAQLGANVSIGAGAIIEGDVVIGDNCEIRPYALICDGARIGSNCKVFSHAVISSEPQDLKYEGERTFVEIGEHTTVREYVTINRGTNADGTTHVGSNNLIMAYCHIAHDCSLGDHVIMSNASHLAGHVHIGNHVTIGGDTLIHQFVHVGDYIMTGGGTKLVKDLSHFLLVDGHPVRVAGVNKIGLRRKGFSEEEIQDIVKFYALIFRSGLNISDGIAAWRELGIHNAHVQRCIDFIAKSGRGIHRMKSE